MLPIMLQMAVLIVLGAVWRHLRPGGVDVETMRTALTGLVYYLLLPALVLLVLWRTPLGLESASISMVAIAGVLVGMGLAWLTCRLCRMPRPVTGAVLLAAGFPNAIYLGLPVLEAVLGPVGRGIAIQYDLFACTPLLFTLGAAIGQAYGSRVAPARPLLALLRVPPLWAAAGAVALNLAQVPIPLWLGGTLELMGAAVVPLMLLSLGMSLRGDVLRSARMGSVVPVVVIRLALVPALVLVLARALGLQGPTLTGVVLEAAMPSMVLGVVFSDRYGLDTPLYAAAVTVSTALALITLPLWIGYIGLQ